MNNPVHRRNRVVSRCAAFLGAATLLLVTLPLLAETTASLAQLQDQFTTLSRRFAPAVVAISATTHSLDATGDLTPEQLRHALAAQRHAVGTGMFIDADGYVLTNEHVLSGRTEIWVTTDNGTLLPAVVVGADPRSDLAVLKVPAKGCPTVTFAKDPALRRGQWTFTLGNPNGLAESGNLSMSVGIVAAVERSLPELSRREGREYRNLIETTTELAPGNSGGPVFNLCGEVVGINSAAILPSFFGKGAAFAFPVTPALLDKIQTLRAGRALTIASNDTTYPRLRWRGLLLAPVPPHWTTATKGAGLLVLAIDPESPLSKSAMSPGSVITAFAGQPVSTLSDFQQLLSRTQDKPLDPSGLTLASAGTPLANP